MRVAVMGAGNGSLATAFDFAQHGHEVSLCVSPEHPGQAEAVAKAGGITSEGQLTGFAPIRYSGTDVARALAGAELVIPVGPAYSTASFAEMAKPHLRPGMAVLVCPTACLGSIVVKQCLGLALDDTSIVVGELSTLPYAVRVVGPGAIRVFLKLKDGVYVAGLPRSTTDQLHDMVSDVWPVRNATSVFQTTLQNGNPVIHPAVTLLNAGLLQRTGGGFLFYEEGVTDAVGRLIEAVDQERLAISAALGVHVLSEPEIGVLQGYMSVENYVEGYNTAPGFRGIGAQGQLDHRYLTEDVGYSQVFLTLLADQLGVETPQMDAIITIASTVLGRDLRGEARRTPAGLGLDALDVAQLRAL